MLVPLCVSQTIRQMRESYVKKLTQLRSTHTKQWEEFFQFDAQRRQQQALQQMSASGFGGYKQQHNYSDYEASSINPHFAGANLPVDSRGGYPNTMENYPSRPHDSYEEFQCQRREDFGKTYNRY